MDSDEDGELYEPAHMRENISMQFSAATGQMSGESLWAAASVVRRECGAIRIRMRAYVTICVPCVQACVRVRMLTIELDDGRSAAGCELCGGWLPAQRTQTGPAKQACACSSPAAVG